MKSIKAITTDNVITNKSKPTDIKIQILGIVSRDYNYRYPNGYRDFSYTFNDILKYFDEKKCDSVSFSLFTIVPRIGFNINKYLKELKNIKALFVEEFNDKEPREVVQYVVYYRAQNNWKVYYLSQKFGSLKYNKDFEKKCIKPFLQETKDRIIGNCAIILCGETNIVKCSKPENIIIDQYDYLKLIPNNVDLFLNPIHDRMTRYEMPMKRKFLSGNNRWTVSVWNKGRKDKNGKIKDGTKPAWTVFHNNEEIEIKRIEDPILTKMKIEMGILDIK
jgi:hypothetical protein